MNTLLKILLAFCLLTLISLRGGAQENLVPNPSFEEYNSCPYDWDQTNFVESWVSFKGTPDYYNSCCTSCSFGTPHNLIGYQEPLSGNAYLGLVFYDKGGEQNNEFTGAQLLQPLELGVKYYFSLNVILKYDNSFSICCGQNKIGVKFFNQTYSPNNPPASNNTPHVYSSSVISDTTNWTQIFGSFIADSTYSHIGIGNFFVNSEITIDDIVPSNSSSYYFIDDICVSEDSAFAANYVYAEITENDLHNQISVYPNPANSIVNINSHLQTAYDIEIYNTVGQMLYSEQNVNSQSMKLDISNFRSGLLFIKITSQNNISIYKLVKQ
ncbi:MAG: T9SS type A sorting domain-containing protein [Bacteroidota bacterium]